MKTGDRLLSLDIFRALAAFLIFIFHSQIFENHGYMGVEILMVLCGFFAMLSSEKKESGKSFFLKRAVRIVPLYWFFTLAMFILIKLRPSLSVMSVANPSDLIKSLLFIPFVNEKGVRAPVLGLGWMLEYQMQFYVIFSAVLFLRGKLFRYRGLLAGLLLLILMLVAKDTFYIEFIYGIVLFYAYAAGKDKDAAGSAGSINNMSGTGSTDSISNMSGTGSISSISNMNGTGSISGISGTGSISCADDACDKETSPLHNEQLLRKNRIKNAVASIISFVLFCLCLAAETFTGKPREFALCIPVMLMIAALLLLADIQKIPPLTGQLAQCSYEFILVEYFTTAFFKAVTPGFDTGMKAVILAGIFILTFFAARVLCRRKML